MKVRNLKGGSGRAVANQFVIEDGNRKVLQSYDSTIVEANGTLKIKKELRKGHDYIVIGRFIVHYCEGMR